MSKILIGLYNGLYENPTSEKFPCWYDGFISGLREYGNELYIWQTNQFGIDTTAFSEKEIAEIKLFDPDLCISFNNILPDVKDYTKCPLITIIVDSIRYMSNLDILDVRTDILIGSFQEADLYILENCGIRKDHLFVTRPYTAIKPDSSITPNVNLSFIGTKFGVPYNAPVGFFAQLGNDAVKKYRECLEYLYKHPLASETEIINACNITIPLLAQNLNAQSMLSLLSAEKRIRILSAVVDLGLDLYGTRSWLSEYHYDSRLNFAYIDKEVWTVEDNQNVYNHSKIGLNISHVQAIDGFPWRVLDILSSNACLVSDYHSGYETVLNGCYFPVYHDEYEARDLCKWLLNDDRARKQIVKECNQYINKNFTLEKLLSQLADITGVTLY